MNSNSLSAYFNENNVKKFSTQKAQIVRLLSRNPNHSRFYVGRQLGISDIAAQRRLSDLLKENSIYVSGEREHGGNTISLYSVKLHQDLYPIDILPTFLEWSKINYPQIVFEYNALKKHEL